MTSESKSSEDCCSTIVDELAVANGNHGTVVNVDCSLIKIPAWKDKREISDTYDLCRVIQQSYWSL